MCRFRKHALQPFPCSSARQKIRVDWSRMSYFLHSISKISHVQPSHVMVWTPVMRVSRIPWKSTRSTPEQGQNCRHLSPLNGVDAPATSMGQGPWGYLHGIQRPAPPTCLRPPLQPPPKNACLRKLCSRLWHADVLQCRVDQNRIRGHSHMFHRHDKDGLQMYVPFLEVTLGLQELPFFGSKGPIFYAGVLETFLQRSFAYGVRYPVPW